MQVKIKICGITNIDDAMAAVEFGADALGFVFFQGSPRYISPGNAASIIRRLPSFVMTIGVFVDEKPEEMEKSIASTGVDIIQLHGDEPPDMCAFSRRIIKAIRVKSLASLDPLVHYQDKVSAFFTRYLLSRQLWRYRSEIQLGYRYVCEAIRKDYSVRRIDPQ